MAEDKSHSAIHGLTELRRRRRPRRYSEVLGLALPYELLAQHYMHA